MASRNIYVSAEAQPLFDEAASLAPSLSAAIEEGLRLYVASKRLQADGFSLVQIVVEERTLEFAGRLLLTAEIGRDGGRIQSAQIYKTAKAQIAVAVHSRPDYGSVLALHERGELWDEMSDEQWWEQKVVRFDVYSGIDELSEAAVFPSSLVDTLRDLTSRPKHERLDI